MLMSKAELVLVYRVMSFFYLYVLKQVKNMAPEKLKNPPNHQHHHTTPCCFEIAYS